MHASTEKSIHSHDVKAPITESEHEVCGYGNATFGDTNDHWIIQKDSDLIDPNAKTIRSLTTRFFLVHKNLNCLLRADGTNLPEWGFKQGEVVCQKKADYQSTSNMWNIESHVNPQCN